MIFSPIFCPPIDGGWGFAPDPAGGAYSTPQTWLVLGEGPRETGWEKKGEERG